MMAMCSYRSWDNFEERFAREEKADGDFRVQSYLQYQGEKIVRRFDANTYMRLTQAMDSHDIARGRGSYPQAISGIRQPALVVSVKSDNLYPPSEQRLLAEHLPNAQHEVLDSDHGHDGFLIKTAELGELIKRFRRDSASREPGAQIRAISD